MTDISPTLILTLAIIAATLFVAVFIAAAIITHRNRATLRQPTASRQ